MTRRRLIYLVTEDWYFVSDTLPLAVAAMAQGYDVAVATRIDKHADTIRNAGLNLLPLERMTRSGIDPLSEARSVAEITALYRREKPDLVHHIALKPVILGSQAAQTAAVPGVVNSIMGLGYVFTSGNIKARALRPVIRGFLKSIVRRPNVRVLVQNSDDRLDVSMIANVPRDNIRLIRGSGVDTNRFVPSPMPDTTPLVVLPGRMLRDKGVLEFVAAARELRRSGIIARFALVGMPDAGNPNSISSGEIQNWVEEGVIEYWGYRAGMPEVLAQASIVCLPSYREGLPKALLEAAACARAIVTTDVPGCREAVCHGENGWLVPPHDAASLARTLGEAIANRELCAKFGATGRQMAENHFAAHIIIGQTLEIYEELFQSAHLPQ